MSNLIRLDPREFPRKPGESWWVVHPNQRGSQFKIPARAVTACIKNLYGFMEGRIYSVFPGEMGWVRVNGNENVYEMPEYVFARYFDAEAFVVGSAAPEELEKAKPFDYKPTLPAKEKKQLELFQDLDPAYNVGKAVTVEDVPGGLGE